MPPTDENQTKQPRGVAFFGDEITAAGFRLAGVCVFSPDPADLSAEFAAQSEVSDLVILTSEYADLLPRGLIEDQRRAHKPLIAVVPDIRGTVAAPDMETSVRRVLGIEG